MQCNVANNVITYLSETWWDYSNLFWGTCEYDKIYYKFQFAFKWDLIVNNPLWVAKRTLPERRESTKASLGEAYLCREARIDDWGPAATNSNSNFVLVLCRQKILLVLVLLPPHHNKRWSSQSPTSDQTLRFQQVKHAPLFFILTEAALGQMYRAFDNNWEWKGDICRHNIHNRQSGSFCLLAWVGRLPRVIGHCEGLNWGVFDSATHPQRSCSRRRMTLVISHLEGNVGSQLIGNPFCFSVCAHTSRLRLMCAITWEPLCRHGQQTCRLLCVCLQWGHSIRYGNPSSIMSKKGKESALQRQNRKEVHPFFSAEYNIHKACAAAVYFGLIHSHEEWHNSKNNFHSSECLMWRVNTICD